MARCKRPQKGERERRSDLLVIRLTVTERAALDAEARRLGLQVSALVRQLIARRRTKQQRAPDISDVAIAVLNRVGNNLSQLARHVKTRGDLAPAAAPQLDHLLTRLEQAIDDLLEQQR